MDKDFDLRAVQVCLDARRAALGLTWAALSAQLGVSSATLRGLGERPRAEGDGVLRVLAWLGRSAESFVVGRAAVEDVVVPAAAARTIRFDTRALYRALDAQRSARGVTWRVVAQQSGVDNAAMLTRLRNGGRVMFPEVMRALAWLGAPAARFVRRDDER